MKKENRKCLGRCPKCSSENIDYIDSEPEGEMYRYKGICKDCKAIFMEWYRLEYIETTY